MSTVAQQRYTAEEYLALERNAEYKSEYVNGRIYAMTGASREHNLIAGNVHEYEYVLIAQDKVRVEHYRRDGEQWVLTEISDPEGVLPLSSLECELPLREIYERVGFDGAEHNVSEG